MEEKISLAEIWRCLIKRNLSETSSKLEGKEVFISLLFYLIFPLVKSKERNLHLNGAEEGIEERLRIILMCRVVVSIKIK